MKNIFLSEGHPRGFASNLICLLGALNKFPEDNIILVPPFLMLYAKANNMGFFDFFEENQRVQMYNPDIHGKISPSDVRGFGSVFPFPSYEEDRASNGQATATVMEELSLAFVNHIRLKKKISHHISSNIPSELKIKNIFQFIEEELIMQCILA